jgi:hypothetical protein
MTEHPKFSKDTYQRCYAFGKNHRRCRLTREEDSKTCHIHRNYYYTWWYAHPPFYELNLLSKRQQRELLFQLIHKHVIIPQEHVAQLHTGFHQYYIFLIKYAGINPLWNRGLMRHILHSCIHRSLWPETYRGEINSDVLQDLLCSPEVCKEAFQMILHYLCYFASSNVVNITPQSIIDMMVYIFCGIPQWMQLFKSQDIDECITTLEAFIKENGAAALADAEWADGEERNTQRALNALVSIRTTVHSTFTTRKMLLKNKMNPIKEELAARAFAPERIARLLDAGLEPEDL